MREIRTYGSEGGAAQTNVSFLPLSGDVAVATVLRTVHVLTNRKKTSD